MSLIKDNLSQENLTLDQPVKIGIVQSEYNSEITDALAGSCLETLERAGVRMSDILHQKVPGAWELAIAAQRMAKENELDAIITLGLILRGETPHFDFIAAGCANGIMQVSLNANIPVIFGVLTTDSLQQAQDRIKGGRRGDKGVEAAQAAIKMIQLNSK